MGTPMSPDSTEGDAVPDLAERRPEVVRRLLARGMPPRAIEILLPGWELLVTESGTLHPLTPQESAAS